MRILSVIILILAISGSSDALSRILMAEKTGKVKPKSLADPPALTPTPLPIPKKSTEPEPKKNPPPPPKEKKVQDQQGSQGPSKNEGPSKEKKDDSSRVTNGPTGLGKVLVESCDASSLATCHADHDLVACLRHEKTGKLFACHFGQDGLVCCVKIQEEEYMSSILVRKTSQEGRAQHYLIWKHKGHLLSPLLQVSEIKQEGSNQTVNRATTESGRCQKVSHPLFTRQPLGMIIYAPGILKLQSLACFHLLRLSTEGDHLSGAERAYQLLHLPITAASVYSEITNPFRRDSEGICDPQLCKLLGFHAREGSDQRMLVYERLFHGSLDRLLYGRSDGPLIDWSARVKMALCAAQGLAFLHEGPFQAMYNEFSTANIQVDKDFSAKLRGYGCVSYNPETEILNISAATANLSVETLERGLLAPKSNVYSFSVLKIPA